MNTPSQSLISAEIMAAGRCRRGPVGAVLHTPEGRVLATGWNGAPRWTKWSAHPNPCLVHARASDSPDEPCRVCAHAETRAFLSAARDGIRVCGAHLLVSVAPCYRCAQLAIMAAVRHVAWRTPHTSSEGVNLLRAAGIPTTGPEQDRG